MARAGNVLGDIASILDVSKSSLEAAISDEHLPIRKAYYRGIATRRNSLRSAQLRYALAGNARLLIWLGVQDLSQRNVKAVELTGAGGEPVKVEGDLGPVVKTKIREFLRSKGKK